jgi:hypothetical protein
VASWRSWRIGSSVKGTALTKSSAAESSRSSLERGVGLGCLIGWGSQAHPNLPLRACVTHRTLCGCLWMLCVNVEHIVLIPSQ